MIKNIFFLLIFIFKSYVKSKSDFEISIIQRYPKDNYLKNKVYHKYPVFLLCEFIGSEKYDNLMLQWESEGNQDIVIEKNSYGIKSKITILPIKLENKNYTCRITEGQHIFQVNLIIPIRVPYLNFTSASRNKNIIMYENHNLAPFTLGTIAADPMPDVLCHFQSLVMDSPGKVMNVFIDGNEVKLHLNKVNVMNSGSYTLEFSNIMCDYEITYDVLVEGIFIKPRKIMYLQYGQIEESFCEIYSYPIEEVVTLPATDKNCDNTTADDSYLILVENSSKIIPESPFFQNNSVNFTNKKNCGSISYICCVAYNGKYRKESVTLISIGTLPYPKALYSNQGKINDNTILLKLGTELKLTCDGVRSMYKNIFWCKNLEGIQEDCNLTNRDDLGITVRNEISNAMDIIRSTLIIQSANMTHNGLYQCKLVPQYYATEYEINPDFRPVNVLVNSVKTTALHFIWSTIVILLLITMTFLGTKYYQLNKIKTQLKQLGLNNFKRGKPESINSELPLDEQADLLPYDKSYELYPETIVIGKLLGKGAFGSVYEGLLTNKSKKLNCFSSPKERSQKVAIKMLKQESDLLTLKALADELKILQHIGKHPNIILLIGAVTKTLHRSHLMIIVEYCKYGALQEFLRSHRKSFDSHLDPQSDTIILKRIQRHNLVGVENEFVKFYNISNGVNDAKLLQKECSTIYPMSSSFSNIEIVTAESKNIAFNSTDLVQWGFQIANGMKFLANLKIVHGDLAARNLLLTDNFVIKICDFGLAKRIYESKNYIKLTGKQLVPARWYAIEALEDLKLSTEADVWSYGVCLWELFSLGRMPYADIEIIDLKFLKKLYNGLRLEKPDFSNKTLYSVMLDCWKLNPDERPTFQFLLESFDNFLNKGYVEGSSLTENESNQNNYAKIEFHEKEKFESKE